MTETPILDERATWKKGFPDLDGDYFSRVDEYDRAPTLIRVESRTSTVQAAVYEFGCGDDLRREYEAEDYEYLGPITPDLVLVMQSQLDQLRATLAQVEQELAEEKRLRSELKHIAQTGISEVSSVGTALKDIALIDFRLRAIQLCKDRAAEWAKQSEEAQARGIQTVADGKASRALAAKELAAELEKL